MAGKSNLEWNTVAIDSLPTETATLFKAIDTARTAFEANFAAMVAKEIPQQVAGKSVKFAYNFGKLSFALAEPSQASRTFTFTKQAAPAETPAAKPSTAGKGKGATA